MNPSDRLLVAFIAFFLSGGIHVVLLIVTVLVYRVLPSRMNAILIVVIALSATIFTGVTWTEWVSANREYTEYRESLPLPGTGVVPPRPIPFRPL